MRDNGSRIQRKIQIESRKSKKLPRGYPATNRTNSMNSDKDQRGSQSPPYKKTTDDQPPTQPHKSDHQIRAIIQPDGVEAFGRLGLTAGGFTGHCLYGRPA